MERGRSESVRQQQLPLLINKQRAKTDPVSILLKDQHKQYNEEPESEKGKRKLKRSSKTKQRKR